MLYGAAQDGGYQCFNAAAEGCGTIFSLIPPSEGQTSWTFRSLHVFGLSAHGAIPEALVLDSIGTLYGTTIAGGNGSCDREGESGCGLIFSLSPPGAGSTLWTYSVVHSLGLAANGAFPGGELVQLSSKVVYGTTVYGGDAKCENALPSGDAAPGCGVIYQFTP